MHTPDNNYILAYIQKSLHVTTREDKLPLSRVWNPMRNAGPLIADNILSSPRVNLLFHLYSRVSIGVHISSQLICGNIKLLYTSHKVFTL